MIAAELPTWEAFERQSGLHQAHCHPGSARTPSRKILGVLARGPVMLDRDSFADFLRRVRGGDEQAATELVRRYETEIRREVRLRLYDASLRRTFDSMDVCQSVLASFFRGATAGQFELDRPEDLLRLLVAMARIKLAAQVRHQRAQRRDHRRVQSVEGVEAPARGPSPSTIVERQELVHVFRECLTAEERQLADLRAQDRGWAEIAAIVGGTPEGRRKQLTRALDRVVQQLGLDEGGSRGGASGRAPPS
jgi:RNA polymerase sigma-70 factor (ECF subfamily)